VTLRVNVGVRVRVWVNVGEWVQVCVIAGVQVRVMLRVNTGMRVQKPQVQVACISICLQIKKKSTSEAARVLQPTA
jgi:hypothetical protein